MATPKSQRIGIWIIAVALTVGTFGSFGAMIFGKGAVDSEEAQVQEMQDQLDAQMKEQAAASEPLEGYEAKAFDADSVDKLIVDVLKKGDGEVVEAESTVEVSYFGWTPDGKIFDSTRKSGSNTPIEFPLSGVIKGWTEGLSGVKAGSTVKLTIPSDKAYGPTGSPPTIEPNQPLQFIVKIKSATRSE